MNYFGHEKRWNYGNNNNIYACTYVYHMSDTFGGH